MNCCSIFDDFEESTHIIKTYNHWKLLLRNVNTTLGNCVAISIRHHEKMSDLAIDEFSELLQIIKDCEKSLKQSFGYDKINYQVLMMKDIHTHIHIIPRYANFRTFENLIWGDEGWPSLPPKQKSKIDLSIALKIKNEIVKNI